jgi:D-arabinose 1-dehydrogenase-like Zn-dependent alcohol dehydrogenase
MAEYVNVPAANLEKLSDKVSFEKASIIADAVASMYRALKNVGEVSLGSKIAILGVGGVGRQGIIIAKLLGAYVACMDRRPQSVAMAAGLGADLLIDSSKEDFLPKIMKEMGPLDVVVDTIGTRESLPMAMEACRRGGKVVVLGYVSPTLEIPSYDLVIREKRVLGSRGVTRNEFREVVGLVNSGRLDPDIGEIIPMAQVNEAFAGLESGKFFTRSVLVVPFDN